jgi:hypothetical protein
VESAVERTFVFGLALRAHRKIFHRGVGAVVRERLDDAESRATIGAIGEGIEEASVLWIKDFAHTIRAGSDVRQHQSGLGSAGVAFADFEAVVAREIEPGRFQAVNGTARGLFGFQSQQEFLQVRLRAFDFDDDALGRIVDPTLESEFGSQAINERSEADTLDGAADSQTNSFDGEEHKQICSGSIWQQQRNRLPTEAAVHRKIGAVYRNDPTVSGLLAHAYQTSVCKIHRLIRIFANQFDKTSGSLLGVKLRNQQPSVYGIKEFGG